MWPYYSVRTFNLIETAGYRYFVYYLWETRGSDFFRHESFPLDETENRSEGSRGSQYFARCGVMPKMTNLVVVAVGVAYKEAISWASPWEYSKFCPGALFRDERGQRTRNRAQQTGTLACESASTRLRLGVRV